MAVVVDDRVSEQAYLRIALEEPDRRWELHDGRLRQKPGMSWEHGGIVAFLSHLLTHQLNRAEFQVRINGAHVRRSADRYYIPDIVVLPTALGREFRGKPGTLPVFRDPLPLVVDGWSATSSDYDHNEKLAEYRARGDDEIWRVHPYERTLMAWRRQPDGSYAESEQGEGIVRPVALPGVAIDLAELFRVVD